MRIFSGRKACKLIREVQKEACYLAKNRPEKLLFDHIPKCGGMTLHFYLEKHYLRRRTFSVDGTNPAYSVCKFKQLPEEKRFQYDLIKGHLAGFLIDSVHPACFKITVLRDPVDRIISHYFYAKSTPSHYLHVFIHKFDISLQDYVTSGLSLELQNYYTIYFSGLPIKKVKTEPKEAVSRAVNRILTKYDMVGFLDELPRFVEQLRNKVNLKYDFPNKRENSTPGRPSIHDVPKSTIRVIEEMNSLDMELYEQLKNALR